MRKRFALLCVNTATRLIQLARRVQPDLFATRVR